MSTAKRRLAMAQWDVFSQTPLEGNSLAIFFDARGLSDNEMQAVAREMNLSETTFILPREPQVEKERGIRARIFTTQEELRLQAIPLWEQLLHCAVKRIRKRFHWI
jgi:trans-2,3-dihydro-3-hydroxyanthranilate isomerase